MGQAIEDGIGQGFNPDHLMPGGDRKLGGHERRAAAVAVFGDSQPLGAIGFAQPQVSGGDPSERRFLKSCD